MSMELWVTEVWLGGGRGASGVVLRNGDLPEDSVDLSPLGFSSIVSLGLPVGEGGYDRSCRSRSTGGPSHFTSDLVLRSIDGVQSRSLLRSASSTSLGMEEEGMGRDGMARWGSRGWS